MKYLFSQDKCVIKKHTQKPRAIFFLCICDNVLISGTLELTDNRKPATAMSILHGMVSSLLRFHP